MFRNYLAASAAMLGILGMPNFQQIESTSTIQFSSFKPPSQRRKAYATGNNQRKIRKLARQSGYKR